MALVAAAGAGALVAFVFGQSRQRQLPGRLQLRLYAILALGLNIVVGWAGLLDLGYIAFFGFGAYGYALFSSHAFGTAGRAE